MALDLPDVYDMMLGGLSSVNASRRQVKGVMSWQDDVRAALEARERAGVTGVVLVGGEDCDRHFGWEATCQEIIRCLLTQVAEAEKLHDEYVAAAARCAADAEVAAELEDYISAAAYLRQAAEYREMARRAMDWCVAADNAAGAGRRLVAGEDQVHGRVAEAIARVGGQVAGDKRYHTAGVA